MNKFTTLANVRWTKRELDRMIKELGLHNPEIKKDSKGYFITECEARTDPLPVLLKILQKQVRQTSRREGTFQVVPGTTRVEGVCAKVREWTSEHPDATVKDAIAAFPDANKTTVRIQYKKAHG